MTPAVRLEDVQVAVGGRVLLGEVEFRVSGEPPGLVERPETRRTSFSWGA